MPQGTPEHPLTGPASVEYRNRNQTVRKLDLDFGTHRKTLYVADYGQRVGLLIEGPKGVLLTRQYRHLISRLSWEIPGGRVEEGETPEAAAKRECIEETGFAPKDLQALTMFHPGLDTLHNPTHLFCCKAFDSAGERDLEEVAGLEWVPLDRTLDMVREGEIVDSLSVIAILSYRFLRS